MLTPTRCSRVRNLVGLVGHVAGLELRENLSDGAGTGARANTGQKISLPDRISRDETEIVMEALFNSHVRGPCGKEVVLIRRLDTAGGVANVVSRRVGLHSEPGNSETLAEEPKIGVGSRRPIPVARVRCPPIEEECSDIPSWTGLRAGAEGCSSCPQGSPLPGRPGCSWRRRRSLRVYRSGARRPGWARAARFRTTRCDG